MASAPSDALKRRAELVRLIERAEADWLAAEQAIRARIQRVNRRMFEGA